MIKVVVKQRPDQPEYWYIDEFSDIGLSAGRTGYKSSREARLVAKQQHPYVNIDIE